MDKHSRNTSIYLVGIIIMFGIIIVVGTQLLSQKKNPLSISLSLAKPSMTINVDKTYIAKITTNAGVFTVELCSKCAPKNVNNFVYLSNKDYYVSTKFHRIIKDLLFQGGDRNTLTADTSSYGKGKTTYLIDDEVNWDSLSLSKEKRDDLSKNGYKPDTTVTSKPLTKYSVAMANDGPNTNSSQFFVITANNDDSRLTDLNGIYTVIGEVKSGFDTIDKINATPVVDSNSYLPSTDVTIQKVEITEI